MVPPRSTKGASKARRDHINHEIRNLRSLLPVSQEDQDRLSYLHSMAAICTYIRKTVLFQGLVSGGRSRSFLPYQDFLQALHGFILVTTAQGKLVYVSENVSDYLGLSMIDVLQGDTFCDMVESADAEVVKANMDLRSSGSAGRSFVCRLQTSKAFKQGGCCSMLVQGSFRSFPQPPSLFRVAEQPLFVALCTPTVDRLQSEDPHSCRGFSSVHRLDMRFTQVSHSVSDLLGHSNEEMEGRSWYGLVHPEDLSSSAESHQSLVQAEEGSQVEMVLRFQCKDLTWTWVYIQAMKCPDSQGFTCQNFIIGETEARFLQAKISADALRTSRQVDSCGSAAQQSPHRRSSSRSVKRRRSSSSPGEELPAAKAKKPDHLPNLAGCTSFQSDSSPVPLLPGAPLFTPPCSPDTSSSSSSSSSSSCSPVQQEELGHELLIDAHGCTDQPLSSPEGSPSYFLYPQALPACHLSAPNSERADQAFEQAAFGLDLASPSSSSPTCYFQACTPDAPLVPDCLSVSDMCDIALDCALHQDDFSPVEQPQGGSEVQAHHVPQRVFPALSGLLTPSLSPSPSESDRYDEREQVEISILAQQISSLASSFTNHHTLNAARPFWPNHCPLGPPGSDLILDDGVFDLILDDLDLVTGKSSCTYQQSIPGVLSPAEHLDALEAFSLQTGHQDQRLGLHQLSLYVQSNLQPEGFMEESLY